MTSESTPAPKSEEFQNGQALLTERASPGHRPAERGSRSGPPAGLSTKRLAPAGQTPKSSTLTHPGCGGGQSWQPRGAQAEWGPWCRTENRAPHWGPGAGAWKGGSGLVSRLCGRAGLQDARREMGGPTPSLLPQDSPRKAATGGPNTESEVAIWPPCVGFQGRGRPPSQQRAAARFNDTHDCPRPGQAWPRPRCPAATQPWAIGLGLTPLALQRCPAGDTGAQSPTR